MNGVAKKPEVQDAIKQLPEFALELIEIAKLVEREVKPDNFVTVFSGIVQVKLASIR